MLNFVSMEMNGSQMLNWTLFKSPTSPSYLWVKTVSRVNNALFGSTAEWLKWLNRIIKDLGLKSWDRFYDFF
jgi:hypothetical protein